MKKTKYIMGLILILGLLLSGCGVSISEEDKVENLVNDFLFCLMHNDWRNAIDLVDMNYSEISKEEFIEFAEEIGTQFYIINYTINKIKIDENQGYVYVTEINNFDFKTSETIKVIKIDDEWKIDLDN